MKPADVVCAKRLAVLVALALAVAVWFVLLRLPAYTCDALTRWVRVDGAPWFVAALALEWCAFTLVVVLIARRLVREVSEVRRVVVMLPAVALVALITTLEVGWLIAGRPPPGPDWALCTRPEGLDGWLHDVRDPDVRP